MPQGETMTNVKLNRKPTKAGKGSVYRKWYNTFSSNHHFTCDPIALVERLDILMASKAAGNT